MINRKRLFYLHFYPFIMLIWGTCNAPMSLNQEHVLKKVTTLPKELKECSGMISVDKNTFIGLNDGGNKAMLYVFDLKHENETRKVKIDSVENNDWEELTQDDTYIYIGDTGNNGGTRQNLMIYKVRKEDVLKSNEIVAEKISFRYEGQTKFNDSNRHNFDCEAMVSVGDSLFLFTKNRGDLRTDVYGLPKIPGSYVVRKLNSFDAKGLISGADYRFKDSAAELILIGYNVEGRAYNPFLIHFVNFSGTEFFGGISDRTIIDHQLQVESVLFHGDHNAYISNEASEGEKGNIYEIGL